MKFSKPIIGAIAATMLLSSPVLAQGWHSRGGWHGHGGCCWRGGPGWGPVIGLGIGVGVGTFLAYSAYPYYPPPVYYPPPGYYPPPVVYVPPPVVYAPPPRTAYIQPQPNQTQIQLGPDVGQGCREYQATAYIGGKPQLIYGTACPTPSGWKIVS